MSIRRLKRPGRALRRCGLIAVLAAAGSVLAGPWRWPLPAWAPRPIVPADNPMSQAKVDLGRRLFNDVRLSANQTQSCASCHQAERGYSDGRALAVGSSGETGRRNSMSLANVAYFPTLTWGNPSIRTLEQQVLLPLFGEHPLELGMGGREAELLARLGSDRDYPRQFRAAFPERKGEISVWTLTRAIAAYERTLLSFDSPYDRYRYGGKTNAISAAAKRGEALFFGERLECYHCHGGLNMTDNHQQRGNPFPEVGFHNTGLYNLDGQGRYPDGHQGLREFTQEPEHEGRFRTPSLRNIAQSGPYMHDGSIATLEQVLRQHYGNKGRAGATAQGPNPLRSAFLQGFELSEQELQDVLAFLNSLSDERFLRAEPAALNRPAGKRR